jgi:hypothetical protein
MGSLCARQTPQQPLSTRKMQSLSLAQTPPPVASGAVTCASSPSVFVPPVPLPAPPPRPPSMGSATQLVIVSVARVASVVATPAATGCNHVHVDVSDRRRIGYRRRGFFCSRSFSSHSFRNHAASCWA